MSQLEMKIIKEKWRKNRNSFLNNKDTDSTDLIKQKEKRNLYLKKY